MNVVSCSSLALAGSFFFLFGCAQGSSIGEGGAGGDGGAGGSIGSTSKATVASSGHTSSAMTSTVSTTTSTGSNGTGTGGGGPTCDFTVDNSCTVAQGLPSVSGDNGGMATTSAVGSHWVQVHMTEDDSSIFSTKDLSYTVTLTNPSGTVYDLYIHEGSDGNGTDCNATVKQGTPTGGAIQTVHDGWSDTQGLGGIDNSRWLSIEIRYVSGNDCTTPWQLKVQGAT